MSEQGNSPSRTEVRFGPEGAAAGDIVLPEVDTARWARRLVAAFGATTPAFAAVAMSQLIALLGENGDCELQVNAAIAVIEGLGPKNEAEALLGLQMVAANLGALQSLGRLAVAQRRDQFQLFGEMSNKFMRTYAAQLETFAKLRRGGEQTVRVEHVHIHAGGQAIVGDVRVQQGGGKGEIAEQPHAPRDPASVPSAEMWREDPERGSLPRPGSKRKTKVPNARRQVAGRAKRQQER